MRDRSRFPGRIHNVQYEHDVHYAMQLSRWILKSIGIWHLIYGHSTQSEKLLSLILILGSFFVLCFVLVPAGPHTLFREKDINLKVKLIAPVSFCLTSAIKYCFLGARVSAIGKCVKHVESDWRIVQYQDHRKMMLKKALIGRRLTTLSVAFLYTGGLSYHMILPLSSRTKINDSFTSKPLVYPGYDLYFDPQASPAYEIVFWMQCLCAVVQYGVTTATCSLAAIFVTHACGQLQILTALLNDLVDGKRTKGTTEKRLSLIAKHHVRVQRFTIDVENVLREICLMELVTASLIICIIENDYLVAWENSDAVAILTYIIILIALPFNILIFCYIGELLVEEYDKVGLAAYEVNWYDLSGHKAVDLVMIITMSHCPPKLTAGNFVDLFLNTFGNVLKTSVVYLNLLRTRVTQ